jgi:hypothetical protein
MKQEISRGVVWDSHAEKEFTNLVKSLQKKQFSQVDAEREARWTVEIKLHRRAVHSAMKQAERCTHPNQKKEVFAQWVQVFGQEQANRLADYFKNEKLRQTILSAWGL